MPESFEDIAVALGEAVVAPSLGHAELLLGGLVALAFLASAVRTLFTRNGGSDEWRERRS